MYRVAVPWGLDRAAARALAGRDRNARILEARPDLPAFPTITLASKHPLNLTLGAKPTEIVTFD